MIYVGNYPLGFHVFTEIEAAKEYSKDSNFVIVEVLYKNVVAFGKNSTFKYTKRDCVISEYMKINKVLEKGSP
jgi:hypothetical protein